MNNFTKIKPEEINDNAVELIGSDWMLITAGTKEKYNTMTAAWGGIGFLWKKPVVFTFIRPTRFTYEFTENSDIFTLCFFEESQREILQLCGTKSGKDIDKMNIDGLSAVESEYKSIYFNEARLVIECKKIYFDDIKPENFLAEYIEKNYPKKDYHRMYVGEILNCYLKKTKN